jgi:hypothetical protein
MAYRNYYNLGKNTNRNITNVYNPSNPLTYCLNDNPGRQFLHGSAASAYDPECGECQVYMATRCAGQYSNSETWDQYCEAYYDSNTKKLWPSITPNKLLSSVVNCMYGPFTTGEHMLRNSLYRKFLYSSICDPRRTYNQFDPNVANSPLIEAPFKNNCSVIPEVHPLNVEQLDSDRLMNKAIDNFIVCSDVLAVIYNYVYRNKIDLGNTRLGKHFQQKSDFYKQMWNRIYNEYKYASKSSY